MSDPITHAIPPVEEEPKKLSKKELNKLAKKMKKNKAKAASVNNNNTNNNNNNNNKQEEETSFNCGDLPLNQSQSRGEVKFIEVSDINESLEGKVIHVRARVHTTRKGNVTFVILRQKGFSIQAVLSKDEFVNKAMLRFVSAIPRESIVDVSGVVRLAKVTSTTQNTIELAVQTFFVVSRSQPNIPFLVEDAARPQNLSDQRFLVISEDIRLDNRVLDLRTPAKQAIFRIQSGVCTLFRELLIEQQFVEIHTPKLIGVASKGGASVFKLPYFNTEAYLAQSPQFYKQMAICSDFERVFEIGPLFRAEHAHARGLMTEFVGLDLEMSFSHHYHEVLDVIDKLFVGIFEGLQTKFARELQVVGQQYPFEPIQFLKPSLRLNYIEGISLLRGAGHKIDDTDYLSTPQERELGRLVKEKYKTDFFILDKFPKEFCSFYTMVNPEDNRYTNSYDLILRGEEISSGAQRIHDAGMLEQSCRDKGVDPTTVKNYIDAFKFGAPPHAGCGVGLERFVMLFLGLHNIRKTSMFPRDPRRLFP